MRNGTRIPSLKECLILGALLGAGELQGFELAETSEDEPDGGGAIVTTLRRLEDEGFVESRTVLRPDSDGAQQRLYSSTGFGAAVYRAWQIAGSARSGPRDTA